MLFIFYSFAPADSRAETVDFRGASIGYENAEVIWPSGQEGVGDIVFKFASPEAVNALTLPGWAKAQFLLVGGGGAGGGGCRVKEINRGGAGGGGAGGYFNTSIVISGGTYLMHVGAGGAASSTRGVAGGNGDSSSIAKLVDDAEVPVDGIQDALGGGGGGAETVGNPGGSGGGGSKYRINARSGTTKAGGAGTAGQGNDGGTGGIDNCGGGGGGATEGGATAVKTGAKGGDGIVFDITGNEVTYCGGGGGGLITTVDGCAAGFGGAGGGGNGGDGTTAAQSGDPGTGGGGGGCGSSGVSGAGGSGVIIVRISEAMPSEFIAIPEGPTITYDGTEKSPFVDSPWYTLSGEAVKTEVGDYTVTLTLKDPRFQWSDRTSGDKQINWKIQPAHVAVPAPLCDGVVYDGSNHVATTNSPIYSFVGVGTDSNQTNATAVGLYHFELALNDTHNWRWDDGSITNQTVNWSIKPAHVAVPEPLCDGVVYDEENHIATTNSAIYHFAGVGTGNNQTNATSAGAYHFICELNDPHNWRWTDESITNQVVNWSILPRQVAQQTLPTGLVYAGTNVVAVTNNEHFYTFTSDSVTNATDAGTYKVTFALTDPANNVWPDGSVTNLTYWWTIARLPIDRPPVPGDTEPGKFVYNGREREIATNSIYWTRAGIYQSTDAGEYTAVLKLNKNWCWKGSAAEDRGSTEDYVIDWEIVQAPNEITSLKLADWKLGEDPKTPSCEARFGADTAVYEYGKNPSGYEWEPTPPETNGVFYVRATIPPTENWKGAQKSKRFLIYKSFDELFTDYVDIEFPSYQGEGKDNAIVLIKISEDIFKGFSYDRCDGGDKLAFMDFTEGQAQAPLSYEVDTWRGKNGESLVWVKIPRLESREGYAKTKIRMYWHLREGMEAPGESPDDVWADYAGVWHFAEEIGTTGADTAISPDSSGHGYDAIPAKGSSGNLSNMVSDDGMIGLARKNASGNYATGGNRFAVTNFENCSTLGTNFIFSGWVYFSDYGTTHAPWIIGRKGSNEDDGWGLALNASARKKFDIYGVATNQFTTTAAATTYDMKSHWEYVTLAVAGGQYWLYTRSTDNGNYDLVNGTLTSPVGDGMTALAFGSSNDGMKPSANAKFDEFRLRKWALGPDGEGTAVTEEDVAKLLDEVNFGFCNLTNINNFESHGWVSQDGVLQNYWIKEPKLTKYKWEADGSDGFGEIVQGIPAIGIVTNYCYHAFTGEIVCTNALPIIPDDYEIVFEVCVPGFGRIEIRYSFTVSGHRPVQSPGKTEQGRILLANDDSKDNWGELSVTNQAYFQTRYVDETYYEMVLKTNRNPRTGAIIYPIITNYIPHVTTTTNATYWTHGGDTAPYDPTRPFLMDETLHTLETTNKIDSLCGGSLLWRLEDVRIGNFFASDLVYYGEMNYLPWSSTSCAISSNGAVFAQREVSHLALRNSTSAQINSACYTNGIGTIYFDAVNLFRKVTTGFPEGKDQRLIVEVATCVTNEFGEVQYDQFGKKMLPTDENVIDCGWRTNYVWSEDGESCTTNREWYSNETYCARAKWEPFEAQQLEIRNNIVVNQTTNETIELNMQTGGTTSDFYRIIVPVKIYEPARFRIRRTTKSDSQLIDQNAYILVDNIYASTGAIREVGISRGEFDKGKRGPNVLGMELATSIPYPSVTDKDIRIRAYLADSEDGTKRLEKPRYVTGMDVYWRPRYLNQNLFGGTGWNVAKMRYRNGIIESDSLFERPLNAECDIEYYIVTRQQAPFYSYVDYSGSGVGLGKGPDGKPYYTEEIPVIECHFYNTKQYEDLGFVKNGHSLPSLGDDWFFRLRNGHDLHGSAALVVTEGPLVGEYPMYLAEDNVWRCLLPLPKTTMVRDATAREGWREVSTDGQPCKFYFAIYDEQTPGATEFVRNTVYLHPVDEMKSIPAKGKVETGRVPREFKIDLAATHLEWRLNDEYDTFAVTRAEYQDFNDWSDVHSPKAGGGQDFFANYSTTNGVNLVDMKTYPAPIADWTLYQPGKYEWNEIFDTEALGGDEEDYGYPREEIFPAHDTPNLWSGSYIAFVQEGLGTAALAKEDGVYHKYPKGSGLAGKIIGQGKGSLTYNLQDRPDGLEEITFRARIGQSIEEAHFAYSIPASFRQNYVFTTLASMSHMITGNALGDMAAGATLSLIAYYRPKVGFYEFRIERIEKDAYTMMSIWKWHQVNGALKSECLVKRRMNVAMWTDNTAWKQGDTSNNNRTESNATIGDRGPKNPQYRLMFISVENSGSSTKIYGGISHDARLPYSGESSENDFNGTTKLSDNKTFFLPNGFDGVSYEDTATDRGKYGAYGVGAKDCPAVFLKPKHGSFVRNITTKAVDGECIVGDANAKYFWQSGKNADIGTGNADLTEDWPEISYDDPDIPSQWALPPNRIEPYYNNWKTGMQYTHNGLRMPENLKQDVIVEVARKGHTNDWTTVGTMNVAGYGFADYRIPLYMKDQYNVRFTTGTFATDVVLDDIVQRQWMGADILNITGKSKDFVYTQGHVVTNTTAKRVEIELVPARAHAETALSVRSPVIDGIGKISFDYAGAIASTEIWVQMATNNVANNLTGANGYNNSIRSVEAGQQQDVGEWITLAKYTYTNSKQEFALGASGTKTVYVGLHDQKPDRRIQGAFRLFIPPAKVEYTDTRTSEQLDAGDKDYGKITITGLTVWDEPGLDERSWRGWNLRTVGDDKDGEKRMYLCDMTLVGKEGEDKSGYGLVCGLNNSINNVPGEAPEKVRTGYPAIWSPTLGTYTNEYGKLTQASVGEVTFKARVYENAKKLKGGKVTIYGASHSVIGKWTKIADFEITEPYFQNFSWKSGGEPYAAIRFEVTDPSAKTTTAVYDRVLLDEITITERVAPTLSFSYAWPFRDGLNGSDPILNVGTREQQPLAGENWGVQTKLTLQQLGDDVDISRGLEIYLSYFNEPPTEENWGYENWKDRKTGEVKLEQVGDASNLVFRSVSAVPESVMAPSPDAGTVVQFMLRVKYYDKGGYEYWDQMHTWTPPSWYDPVDYNKSLGAKSGGFAAFTILDTISPGRAWINEVQWNNGGKSVTHTGSTVEDNQFVEVCVPSGVDMSGWWLRVYDMSAKEWTMAKFGKHGVAASKTSGDAVNGYEFFVLMSPKTDSAGGFVGPGGIGVTADGVWNGDSLTGGGVKNGVLKYSEPFAFELVRPSGVIEHTFVLGGTNEWGEGYGNYEPEGLLEKLKTKAPDGAARRFVAGHELNKNSNGGTYKDRDTTYGSSGVVGDQGSGGPGSEGTWKDGLDFTAGQINPGQVIPEGWFLAPNGTNTWVYFSVVGDHIAQKVGGSTNRTELVILPQGMSTNVVYTAAPWWETATIAVDGEVTEVHQPRTYDYHFSVPEGAGTMVRVVATEGVDARLDDDKFKLKGQRYRNAVLNWLGENWPEKSPDDIRFARVAQLRTPVATQAMTLIDMYWLDICPFNTEGSTFEPTPEMDPLSSEWVLRGGFTDYKPNAIVRHKNWGLLTNSVFKVKMFITNEFDCVNNPTYAPYTLQGIGNERSCDYTGNWTSETFKINGFLDVNRDGGFNKGFLPFREFVFNRGSFAPAGTGAGTPVVPGDELSPGVTAGTPGDFEAVIELLDPFSGASTAGASYGWWRWPNTTPAFFSWRITHTNSFLAVEQLLPQSTYGE